MNPKVTSDDLKEIRIAIEKGLIAGPNCINIDDFYPANSTKITIQDFYPSETLCCHCLESGYWEDEDKCPKCTKEGHTSPWRVSSCPVCNKEYHDKMNNLIKKMGIR